MTKQEIENIRDNDVLLNFNTREIVQIKRNCGGYFEYAGAGHSGCFGHPGGTIPKTHLDEPSWISLMRDKDEVVTPNSIIAKKCKQIQETLLNYFEPGTVVTITKDWYKIEEVGGNHEERKGHPSC